MGMQLARLGILKNPIPAGQGLHLLHVYLTCTRTLGPCGAWSKLNIRNQVFSGIDPRATTYSRLNMLDFAPQQSSWESRKLCSCSSASLGLLTAQPAVLMQQVTVKLQGTAFRIDLQPLQECSLGN